MQQIGGQSSTKQSALALAHQARNEFFQGNWLEAERLVRESLTLNPRFAPAYDLLCSLLEQAGRFEESAAVARDGLKVEPTSGSLYFHLVRSRRIDEGDRSLVSEIEEVLRTRKPTDPDRRYLHYALGKAHDDSGEYREAMENWALANALSLQLQFNSQDFNKNQYRAFFDRAASVYSSNFLGRNSRVGSDSNLPILIVGMPRSGTTLVEQILSNHPDVAAGGEVPYWISRATNHLAAAHPNLSVAQDFAKSVQAEYLSALSLLARSRPHVTDKMPDNYMVLGWIHTLFPKAPIIHVRRHPADNCLSIYATPYSRPPRYAYRKESIAYAYECHVSLMDHWRRILPANSILELSYEDLVLDTERTLRTMIEFCSLPWDDACLAPETNQRIVQTPSAWQVRQPINNRSIMKWKHYEPWLGALLRR